MRRKQLLARDEVECWQGVFRCGTDYFDELEPLGVKLNVKDPKAVRKAAREPWMRLVGSISPRCSSLDSNRPVPWALNEFGEPD